MKIKDHIQISKLNLMRLRARGLSTKPTAVLERQLETLTQLVMTVTNQRDEIARAYAKLFEEKNT